MGYNGSNHSLTHQRKCGNGHVVVDLLYNVL